MIMRGIICAWIKLSEPELSELLNKQNSGNSIIKKNLVQTKSSTPSIDRLRPKSTNTMHQKSLCPPMLRQAQHGNALLSEQKKGCHIELSRNAVRRALPINVLDLFT